MDQFVNAHINNLTSGIRTEYFKALIQSLGDSYQAAIRALPPEGVPLIFGRFLLVCDKAMRTAALLIAGREPEDSVAITRRAIEAARTALAIKLNDANATVWLAARERMERWAARQSNEKPKFFKVALTHIQGEPLISELDKFLGVLSDAYVHFTPEYYSSLAWEVRRNEAGAGGQILLNYFHTNEREVERHYLMLAAVHGIILRTFDRTLDGRLAADRQFQVNLGQFLRIRHKLSHQYRERYPEAEAPDAPQEETPPVLEEPRC